MDYETASYLCHHGVKGMKWGVRKKSDRVKIDRQTRKQMRKDMRRYSEQETNRANKKYKIDKQRESLRKHSADTQLERKLAKDYGVSTKGERVRKEKAQKLRKSINDANSEANRKATDRMVKKYGKKQVDSFNKSETRRGIATVAAVGATLIVANKVSTHRRLKKVMGNSFSSMKF